MGFRFHVNLPGPVSYSTKIGGNNTKRKPTGEGNGGCFGLVIFFALMGAPFYLWQQGHVWGEILGILSGLVIYPSTILYFIRK